MKVLPLLVAGALGLAATTAIGLDRKQADPSNAAGTRTDEKAGESAAGKSMPSGPAQKAFTAIAAIAVVVLVLYGLTHQRDEPQQETASAPTTQTTGAAPPASPQESNRQQASQAEGGDQQAQPQQGNNQGTQENKPQGQAQGNQGAGNATPRATTGAAPKPPAGAPESATHAPEKQK